MTSYVRGLIVFKRGRQLILFLFCLFLAFIIWSVHNLSENYSHYFLFKLNVSSNIPGREQSALSNNRLALRGRSSGFYILKHKLFKNTNLLFLNIEPHLLKEYSKDLYFITPELVREQIIKSLEDRIILESFGTDTLFFNFKEVSYKEVDVVFRYSASYKDQFMQNGGVRVTPSKINIYGDPQLINEIDTVFTVYKDFINISKDISGLVNVEKIKGIRYSTEEIYYNLDVVRFVETTIEFIDLPTSIIIRVPFKDIRLVKKDDFNLIIEKESDILLDGSQIFIPKLVSVPEYVINYRFDPPFIKKTK